MLLLVLNPHELGYTCISSFQTDSKAISPTPTAFLCHPDGIVILVLNANYPLATNWGAECRAMESDVPGVPQLIALWEQQIDFGYLKS